MKLSYIFGLLAICSLAAFLSGFFYGRHVEENSNLKTTIMAYENRKQIEDEILQFSPYDLCLALGGVPDDCTTFLRGVDKTTTP